MFTWLTNRQRYREMLDASNVVFCVWGSQIKSYPRLFVSSDHLYTVYQRMINPEISIVATEKHRRQFFAVDFINSLGIICGNCRLPREIHRADILNLLDWEIHFLTSPITHKNKWWPMWFIFVSPCCNFFFKCFLFFGKFCAKFVLLHLHC